MTKRGLGIVGVVLGLLLPQSAGAQEFLKDKTRAEGIGIKTGDLELHPGIAGELGYDSNWFLRSNKTGGNLINGAPSAPPIGSGLLRITPSLSLATIGAARREGEGGVGQAPSLVFRAGLAATYREFFGEEQIRKQRNVSGGADLRLDILPQRPWGGAIFANYGRIIQPTVIGNPDLSFNRDDVGAGAEVIATPGGGTLDWRLGYQFRATIFEDVEGKGFDNITHEANTRGRWKFRPRTALLYDATLRFINYADQGNGLHNSTPVRARVGMSGLITSRLSLLAMVGYGASFYETTRPTVQQFDSVIGQVEAKLFLTGNPGADQPGAVSLALSSLAIGYARDFQNSYLGDFYTSDRGYAKISYFFAGRALIALEGGVGAIEYPTLFYVDGTQRNPSFTDVRADATLFGEYRITETFAVNLTGRYTQNFSSTQLALQPGAGAVGTANVYDMSWQRLEAFAGVRWFM
jgi:hypothetical protein